MLDVNREGRQTRIGCAAFGMTGQMVASSEECRFSRPIPYRPPQPYAEAGVDYRRRPGRAGGSNGPGPARLAGPPPRSTQSPGRPRQLLSGPRQRSAHRYLPAREHGLLHQFRPFLPDHRHRPHAPAATEFVFHDTGSAPEPISRRSLARAFPPAPQLPGLPLPHACREDSCCLWPGMSAAGGGRNRSAFPGLAGQSFSDAANHRPLLGPGSDQRSQ